VANCVAAGEENSVPPNPRLQLTGASQLLHGQGRLQLKDTKAAVAHIAPTAGKCVCCKRLHASRGEVARFVEGLTPEPVVRSVLEKGFWRAGRKFLEATQLTEQKRARLSWITSWRGTYDWPT